MQENTDRYELVFKDINGKEVVLASFNSIDRAWEYEQLSYITVREKP